MQKARDRVRDYFSRYVPRYKGHKDAINRWYMVKLLSDDPVFISVSVSWKLIYGDDFEGGSLINRKKKRILYEHLASREVPRRCLQGHIPTGGDLSHTRAVERVYPNVWFINWVDQKTRSSNRLPYWLAVSKWIRMKSRIRDP